MSWTKSEVTFGRSSRISITLNTISGEVLIHRFIAICCGSLLESLSISREDADDKCHDMSSDVHRAVADFILRFFFKNGSNLATTGKMDIKRVTMPPYVLATNAVSVQAEGSLHLSLRCMFTTTTRFSPLIGNKRSSENLMNEMESYGSHDLQHSLFESASVTEVIANFLTTLTDDKHISDLVNHCKCVLDQCYIRRSLDQLNGVAFVGNGSILPRNSTSQTNVVPFVSPESLQHTIELPFHGRITGMLIPTGVTGTIRFLYDLNFSKKEKLLINFSLLSLNMKSLLGVVSMGNLHF